MDILESNYRDPITDTQRSIIFLSLAVTCLIYFGILCFILFNFWRIMIKQGKIALIPLTIFYLCAMIIVVARIVNNSAYYFDYRAEILEDYSK